MLKQDLIQQYGRHVADLEAMRPRLHAYLGGVLSGSAVRVHHISSRVKEPASLAAKLARPDRTYGRLEEVTDLLGLRVITYFEDGVDEAARLVERHFRVDIDRSVDKRLAQDPSTFGYRSLHYICPLPEQMLAAAPEWRWSFEIQIRSILQHAWAEIEHDLGYKSTEAVPHPVRRRFSRLAGLLELADSEFVEIRRTMVEYARDLRESLPMTLEAVELDAVSLASMLEAPGLSTADQELATHLNRRLSDSPFFPDYLLRALSAAQFNRPSQVLRRLEAFRERMPAFADRYFRFTAEAFGFDSASIDVVHRGYSLVLLAHAQVLAGAELELHRAEHMRAFFERVDYPHDDAEAKRVARLFVRYFEDWTAP